MIETTGGLGAEITSLKTPLVLPKLRSESQTDHSMSSASELGMFSPSRTPEAESSIPDVNLACKFCNFSDPDVSLTPDDAQQPSESFDVPTEGPHLIPVVRETFTIHLFGLGVSK